MCGIVGFSIPRKSKYHRVKGDMQVLFTEMLLQAQKRGSAATGVTLITKEFSKDKPTAYVLRAPLCAKDFVETKEYKEILDKLDGDSYSIIGHTRAVSESHATARDNQNNHPFITPSFLGVHNGRIMNDVELWKEYAKHIQPKSKCDSEVLFSLAHHFYTSSESKSSCTAIEKTLQQSLGWWAMAAVNLNEPNSLYLVKSGAPLEIINWSWLEITMFSSEFDYVEEAVKKTGKPGSRLDRIDFPEDVIFTLDSFAPMVAGSTFSGRYTLKLSKDDKAKQQSIIEENQEAFNITQGA